MDITGEQLIHQPQDVVWKALNDPRVLQACMPGCDSIDLVGPDSYQLGMMLAIGPVKARFSGHLTLSEVSAPDSYVMTFDGSGGAAGFGKGRARVALAPQAEGTRLQYVATAQVGGKIAQVGSRLIDGVARRLADEFFKRLSASLAARPAAD